MHAEFNPHMRPLFFSKRICANAKILRYSWKLQNYTSSCSTLVNMTTAYLQCWKCHFPMSICWSVGLLFVNCSIGLLVYWSICLLVYWSTGLLVYWSIGLLVYWSIGLLVYWSMGLLFYWSVGLSVIISKKGACYTSMLLSKHQIESRSDSRSGQKHS